MTKTSVIFGILLVIGIICLTTGNLESGEVLDEYESNPFGKQFCTWCPIVINTIDFGFNDGNRTEQMVVAMDIFCRLLKMSETDTQQCLNFMNNDLPKLLDALTKHDMTYGYKMCHVLFNCSDPFGDQMMAGSHRQQLSIFGSQSDPSARACSGCLVGAAQYASTLLGLTETLFEELSADPDVSLGVSHHDDDDGSEPAGPESSSAFVYRTALSACQQINMCPAPTKEQEMETELALALVEEGLAPIDVVIPTFSNCYNCQLGMGSVVLIVSINETFYLDVLTKSAARVCNATVNGTTFNPCQLFPPYSEAACFFLCTTRGHPPNCLPNITIPAIPYPICEAVIHNYINLFFKNILSSLEPCNFCSYNSFCNATSCMTEGGSALGKGTYRSPKVLLGETFRLGKLAANGYLGNAKGRN